MKCADVEEVRGRERESEKEEEEGSVGGVIDRDYIPIIHELRVICSKKTTKGGTHKKAAHILLLLTLKIER